MALLPYTTRIEFTVQAPSVLDPSRPNMGVTAPGGTVHGKVVSAGVGTNTVNELRAGDSFWCEPAGIRVIQDKGAGTQLVNRWFVDRSYIVGVEPL